MSDTALVALLVATGLLGLAVGWWLTGTVHPVPARRPLVELVCAALFVAVPWRLVDLGQGAAVPALLVFTAAGVALSGIDLAEHRLPDAVVLPCYPVLVGLLGLAAALTGDGAALLRALLGGGAFAGCLFAMALVSPRSMGLGDVKLAGVVGLVLAWFSWSTLLVGAFAAFLLGAVVGVVLIASGRAGRRTAVAFGPFLVAGALLSVFVTDPATSLLTTG